MWTRVSSKWGLKMHEEGGGVEEGAGGEGRSMVPQRQDMCRIFVSGVIGVDPKEAYLSHGHYVINFPIATVGHFNAQHDWEKYKPAETMWLSSEMWDSVAKQAMEAGLLYKGARIYGMGTILLNKWVDKTTGEDRKALKLRILQLLSPEELEDIEIASGPPEDYSNPTLGGDGDNWGSNFGATAPPIDDQTMRTPRPTFDGASDVSKTGGEDEDRDPRIPF